MNESLHPNSAHTAQPPSLSRTIEIHQSLEDELAFFERIKPEKMTLEIICQAISRSGSLLEHVPESLKTREICILAIISDFKSFLYVPERFIDQAFIDLSFTQLERSTGWYDDETCTLLYNKVPKCLLTQWHYAKLIAFNGIFLKWLPSEMIDYELCYEALVSDGMLIKYVPSHLIDNSMCYQALHQDRDARAFIPESLWDKHCERILARKAKSIYWHGGF